MVRVLHPGVEEETHRLAGPGVAAVRYLGGQTDQGGVGGTLPAPEGSAHLSVAAREGVAACADPQFPHSRLPPAEGAAQ